MENAKQLPNQIKIVWIIRSASTLLTLLFIGIIGIIADRVNLLPHHILLYFAVGIIVIGIILFTFELALIQYRFTFWRYAVTANAIQIQSGYIFRRTLSIPIARVQDVAISAGPILQFIKLQKVDIATASTHHSIDGLNLDTAEALRKQIMQMAMEVNDIDV